MKKLKFYFPLFFVACLSCSKNDTNTSANGTNTNNNNSTTITGNVGTLLMNIKWTLPSPTLACPITSFIDLEINCPTSNTSQSFIQSSPIRIDKRLAIGSYTYTIKKRPNANCFNFTTVVKSGSFTINACPTLCGNATILNFTLD